MVQEVGVHEVQGPADAAHYARHELGLPPGQDLRRVQAVQGQGLQDGEQRQHEAHQAAADQDVLLQRRPEEVVRGLETEVIGRHHRQQNLGQGM